jgi:triosephosphate isomerase (TIM)
MRTLLIAGNWKMHTNAASAQALACRVQESARVNVLLVPPAIYLSHVASVKKPGVMLGAQDVAEQKPGAYTGEIAAEMLADVGCRYVLVGHSERRHVFGESPELVGRKCARALEAGLRPIVCVGETLSEREAEQTQTIVLKQLNAVLAAIPETALAKLTLSYEPVWAIGTGKTATPEQAQAVHQLLRSEIAKRDAKIASSLQILYGGSVKSANAKQLLAEPDIDGALVGGAALDAGEFNLIISAAESLS